MTQARFFLVIALLGVGATNASTNPWCKRRGCTNATCVPCPVGQGVVNPCTKTSKTKCERCVAGRNFSNSASILELCQPTSICLANQIVDITATASRDLTCRCADGWTTSPSQIGDGGDGECNVPRPRPTNSAITTNQSSTSGVISPWPGPTEPSNNSSSSTTSGGSRQPGATKASTSSSSSSMSILTIATVLVCSVSLVVVVIVVVLCRLVRVSSSRRRVGRRNRKGDGEQMVPLVECDGDVGSFVVASVGERNFKLKSRLGRPWTTATWTKNGMPIKGTQTSLLFKEVTLSDAGTYCCSLRNAEKQVEIQLVIKADLAQHYRVEENAMLELKFFVCPRDFDWSYKWFRNGCSLVEKLKEYKGENSSHLVVFQAGEKDSYYCVAQAANGIKVCSHSTIVVGSKKRPPTPDTSNGKNGIIHNESAEKEENSKELSNDDTESAVETQAVVHRIESRPVEATSDHPQRISYRIREEPELVWVSHLSHRMMNALALTMDGYRFPSSLREIAETLDIDVHEVQAVISRQCMSPGYFILTTLTRTNNFYSLVKLCSVFVDCNRPDCALRLVELAEKAGKTIRLPEQVRRKMHLHEKEMEVLVEEAAAEEKKVAVSVANPLPGTPPPSSPPPLSKRNESDCGVPAILDTYE